MTFDKTIQFSIIRIALNLTNTSDTMMALEARTSVST